MRRWEYGRTQFGPFRHVVRMAGLVDAAELWPARAYCGRTLFGPVTDRQTRLCGGCERAMIAEERAARDAPDPPGLLT